MLLLHILWIANIVHLGCSTQLSIHDEVLKEKSEWIQPGGANKFQKQSEVAVAPSSPCEQPTEIGDLQRKFNVAEKQLSKCEASLLKFQMAADLSENGKLDADLVYLKKIVVALLNRFERASLANRGVPTQLQMIPSEAQLIEMKNLVGNLDRDTAAHLAGTLQIIIDHGQITYDRVEPHSNLRQLYLDLCVIFREIDLFFAIQISIVVCAVVFAYVAATCRSKLVTLSYLVLFGSWISYFWHWQNMLRKSQANRHLLSQKNPCEDSRSFYNPLRFFNQNSEECEKYLRKMFTPMFWEFTPIEVLCDMVATYTSNVVSVLIVNTMGAIGDAIREFSDKQSWFSVVPAFAVLLIILLIILFKLSGYGVSLFYGALSIAPSVGVQSSRSPLQSSSREIASRTVGQPCCAYSDVGRETGQSHSWQKEHWGKVRRRGQKKISGLNTEDHLLPDAGSSQSKLQMQKIRSGDNDDSDTYLSANEP